MKSSDFAGRFFEMELPADWPLSNSLANVEQIGRFHVISQPHQLSSAPTVQSHVCESLHTVGPGARRRNFYDFSLIKFGWVEGAAAAEGFGPSAGGATHPKRRCDR